MSTLKELNKKVWYRFLKVVYILFYLPLFVILFFVLNYYGRDYIEPVLPDNVQEVFNDPEFYKLNEFDMIKILSSIDNNLWIVGKEDIKDNTQHFEDPLGLLSKPRDLLSQINIKKMYLTDHLKDPIPTTPLNKKYFYKSYHSWNITRCILYGVLLTLFYILFMECIRRGFYYVLIGKVFPRE